MTTFYRAPQPDLARLSSGLVTFTVTRVPCSAPLFNFEGFSFDAFWFGAGPASAIAQEVELVVATPTEGSGQKAPGGAQGGQKLATHRADFGPEALFFVFASFALGFLLVGVSDGSAEFVDGDLIFRERQVRVSFDVAAKQRESKVNDGRAAGS